jgi:hypothetical protein
MGLGRTQLGAPQHEQRTPDLRPFGGFSRSYCLDLLGQPPWAVYAPSHRSRFTVTVGGYAWCSLPQCLVMGSLSAGGQAATGSRRSGAGDGERLVAAFQSQVLDVRAGRLRDSQPVEGEQGDQGVLGGRSESCGDQKRAELVAVQGVACDS